MAEQALRSSPISSIKNAADGNVGNRATF